jgi:hypothetical protein
VVSTTDWPGAPPDGWKFAGVTEQVIWVGTAGPPRENPCRVYWGSHGCDLERGHPGGRDAHDCGCCECENHPDPDSGCVGKFPYYGPDTNFYGEDAPQ